MDVTPLLNNYLEPYIHVSLGSKASNDTHRITINPSAPQERNSATNNCFESSYLKRIAILPIQAIFPHAITGGSKYIFSYIYLTTPRQSVTNCIALVLTLKV